MWARATNPENWLPQSQFIKVISTVRIGRTGGSEIHERVAQLFVVVHKNQMAYLTQISDDNYIYSYSGVSGSILKEYMNPAGIEAYLDDESFSETVRQGYTFCRDTEPQWMDAEVKRRFENQKNKTAEWLRRQVRDMRSYRSQP